MVEARQTTRNKDLAPLLLHFDVNKTVIQSDSIQTKTIEEGIREGIAELFWGLIQEDGEKRLVWLWSRGAASCTPPDAEEATRRHLVTYAQYCKQVCKDKEERKEAVKSFRLVRDAEARAEMDKVLRMTLGKMQLPLEIRDTPQAKEAGLVGSTLVMFPAVFHLVAALQRSKRSFGVLFRSFGADHETIKKEWNAFCEMRHPVFSKLISGVGPMDGTVPGVPDRRVRSLHTLYRDAKGDVLILNVCTNGPTEHSWDSWAKAKPRIQEDTRNGREWIHKALRGDTVEGTHKISHWMKSFLLKQGTAAIKDDWAWWTWNGEKSQYGKLLTVISGREETKQLFFDDNIDLEDARIVDCRDEKSHPVPFEESMNKYLTKVNPVEALLDNEYFLRKLQLCHGDHLEMGASLVEFQRQLAELEDQKVRYAQQVKALNQQVQNLTEENRRMRLRRRIQLRDEAQLRDLLMPTVELDNFGKEGRKSLSDLFHELEQNLCWLEHDEDDVHIVRTFEMVFMRIQYKDLVLIESHEQDSAGRIQSRNYLPGVRKGLKESSFDDALAKWFEVGLGVNITDVAQMNSLPLSTPEAPSQQTAATQAYPIPCKVQISQASYTVLEKAAETHKELLGKVGLPSGKHFTTTEQESRHSGRPSESPANVGSKEEGTITRFWRWDKVATWEATTAKPGAASAVDITQVCDKLFRGHPRRDVYENMLLQMFETFTAKKLCGGFSGSVVIRVQPFEPGGKPGEPCIVKLDMGEAIREEYINSENVFQALPDRAARIIGDAVYARNKEGEEFGAMRLELAGACWNVPELAQGSANLLCTFKDLLLHESENTMLDSSATSGDARPFGNVNSVLAETFGPGGIVSSLRKGPPKAGGLHRASGDKKKEPPLPWGWYTLKGKDSKYNPFSATAKTDYPPEKEMRDLYRRYFGTDLPDLKALVVGQIKPKLEILADSGKRELFPLIGLAHGDLNAANIMIDALDAVWLIDFATSVNLPIFTDMCKFEMACFFEYSTIPLTPQVLLSFASTNEEKWGYLNVGDWLRVDQYVAEAFLRKLVRIEPARVKAMTPSELENVIQEVATEVSTGKPPHKRREVLRALQARVTANASEMDNAFNYCGSISHALLKGEYIFESLNVKVPPVPNGSEGGGTQSLRYFMELTSTIRRFSSRETQSVLRESTPRDADREPCDASSLQIWLPVLRETYRLPGYRDISPQHKVWAIHHCTLVAQEVLKIIDRMNKTADLRELQIMKDLIRDCRHRRDSSAGRIQGLVPPKDEFTEADSLWLNAHKDVFSANSLHHDRMVRTVHSLCPMQKARSGLFAPIYKVYIVKEKEEKLAKVNFGVDGANSLWKISVTTPDESFEDNQDIGYAAPAKTAFDSPVITLSSRLLFLHPGVLRKRLSDIKAHLCAAKVLDGDFNFGAWAHGLPSNKPVNTMRSALGMPGASVEREGRDHKALQRSGSGIPVEAMQEMFEFDATAHDGSGKEELQLKIVIGLASICYPPGTKLCFDAPTVPDIPMHLITGLDDQGSYIIANPQDPNSPLTHEIEVFLGTHIYMKPCRYPPRAKIIFGEESSWTDAEVIDTACESNGWRHRLSVSTSVVKQASWVPMDRMDSCSVEESLLKATACEKTLADLSCMSSGENVFLSAASYEDEMHKMKVFYRARHSFIIDALSGNKIDVKSCALPTMTLVNGPILNNVNSEEVLRADSMRPRNIPGSADGGSVSVKPSSKMTSFVTSANMHSVASNVLRRKTSFGEGGDSRSEGGSSSGRLMLSSASTDSRGGWGLLLKAVENYNLAIPSCGPYAFLVWGSPGSGKTCLSCRLIMDCLDRQGGLVPVLLSVSDLVKRSDQEPNQTDSAKLHMWFDKYLRITFGEDSQRYRMARQAMSMHRVMFLIEGLEDAGTMMSTVEHLIQEFVLDRHLVVVTSRPLLAGQCTLVEELREYMVTFNLEHLTNEQKRAIAHSRLGGKIASYDRFMLELAKGHDGKNQDDTAADSTHEDVFGNPMMLSMLICYLTPSKDDNDEVNKKDDCDVSLTAVYRVAIDVMLQRVQSRKLADRHNKEEKVAQCKRVLEKMAMSMQLSKKTDIDAGAFEASLGSELGAVWAQLAAAVEAGHAMFLRTSRDAGRLELRFLVRGFQSFFAASEINAPGGEKALSHVELEELLTDSWWKEMLEMLAAAWPHKYVKLIEQKLKKFAVQKGDSFLHLAAQKNHMPAFQLLKLFTESNQEKLFTSNAQKQTPLHVGAEKGFWPICSLMLEQKASLDAEDDAERLPMHVAMQHGKFDTARQLLERWNDLHHGKGRARPAQRDNPAEKLAAKLSQMTEQQFKTSMEECFVELRYFGREKADDIDRKRSIGALMAVYWIVGAHYDKFVRGQKEGSALSKQSWANLQDWTRQTVDLTSNHAKVAAMLVMVAIQTVGKIKPFKKTFASDYEDPSEVLAHVLQKDSVLIPSFSKLDAQFQETILSALKADFNFGQFLQAENLPASLENVKKIVGDGERSPKILAFFLFRIFASMCGLFFPQCPDGCTFMTEEQYTTFKVGVDVLQHLTKESSQEVYDRYLARRAQKLGYAFDPDKKESRAQVRLACQCRFMDPQRGKEVIEAFEQLTNEERGVLNEQLTANGIEVKGFLLYHSPDFMRNAHGNPKIGILRAMKMLVRVYQTAAAEFEDSQQRVITIYCEALASYVKNCQDPEAFSFTKFDIRRPTGQKANSQGTVHLSPWQLENSEAKFKQYQEAAERLIWDMKDTREPAFLKKLPEVFPEIAYMTGDTEEVEVVTSNGPISTEQVCKVKKIYQQTICSMTVIYWVVGDQYEAFIRAQLADDKLTEGSWKDMEKVMDPVLEQHSLDVVFVAMLLHSLGKIPKFREQLAPNAKCPREVMQEVMKTCPNVLPSFIRLQPDMKECAKKVLTRDFDFQQFLHAENIPASLLSIKEMLNDEDTKAQYLETYLAVCFAEAAGSLGAVSQEGSLYMTRDRFAIWSYAMQALRALLDNDNVGEVYTNLLERRSELCGFVFESRGVGGASWKPDKPEDRAKVRLACLAQITNAAGVDEIHDTFRKLDPSERAALTQFLNADGVRERPGFILCDSPKFLQCARANKEVGLLPATRIMLRVYEDAAKEFKGSAASVITIQLGKLTTFAKEFFGAVQFEDMHFSLERQHETEALVIPKKWVPVNSRNLLDALREDARVIATEVLNKRISEDNFKSRISRVFPELNYFDVASTTQRDQTLAAMLSVFWLVSQHHEAFVRNQEPEEPLSKQSWVWIQDWMLTTVKLTTPEVVDAILVFMAIHALGKIKEFRSEFCSGFSASMHDTALAHVLETKPQVAPSFNRLTQSQKDLIIDSLSVDFQFSMFLHAENTPLALKVIQDKMKKHGEDGLAFFCFRIFVQACGKLGAKSLKGSEFMNEPQFKRFKPGLEALLELRTRDAVETYNNFLLLRGSKAMSRFASPEHQALSRLLTLAQAYDHTAGNHVCEAFDRLKEKDPKGFCSMTKWLNADGSKKDETGERAYVLCDAPLLLESARNNAEVGLLNALHMLVLVQRKCEEECLEEGHVRVVVNLRSLADWARDAGARRGNFLQAELSVKPESQGDTKILTIEVDRPRVAGVSFPSDELRPSSEGSSTTCRTCPLYLFLVLGIACWGLAFCLTFSESASDTLLPGSRTLRRPVSLTLAGAAALLVMLFICRACFDPEFCQKAPVSVHETGPREPFLRLDAFSLNPRQLSRNGRHQYSRLQMEDDDTV